MCVCVCVCVVCIESWKHTCTFKECGNTWGLCGLGAPSTHCYYYYNLYEWWTSVTRPIYVFKMSKTFKFCFVLISMMSEQIFAVGQGMQLLQTNLVHFWFFFLIQRINATGNIVCSFGTNVGLYVDFRNKRVIFSRCYDASVTCLFSGKYEAACLKKNIKKQSCCQAKFGESVRFLVFKECFQRTFFIVYIIMS